MPHAPSPAGLREMGTPEKELKTTSTSSPTEEFLNQSGCSNICACSEDTVMGMQLRGPVPSTPNPKPSHLTAICVPTCQKALNQSQEE